MLAEAMNDANSVLGISWGVALMIEAYLLYLSFQIALGDSVLVLGELANKIFFCDHQFNIQYPIILV